MKRVNIVDEKNTHYLLACAALWTICSMWYDLNDEYHISSETSNFVSRPPDDLANIALELAHDPCDVIGLEYSRPIESFAEYWLPKWINELSLQASYLVRKRRINRLTEAIHYLYLGFVFSVALEFCVVAKRLGVYSLKHNAQYNQIVEIAQTIEADLIQAEHRFLIGDEIASLKQQRLEYISSLETLWIEGVTEGKFDQESNYYIFGSSRS